MTRIWDRPVNAKTAKGWEAIDNALAASKAGGFVKGSGGYDLRVPSTLADPLRLRDGDRWIELKLRGSAASAKVSGTSATFSGAGKGADLKVSAFNDAIKEDLILAGADSQSTFSYDVGLSAGLKLELRKDGGADVVDEQGEIAFAIPAPIAEDAAGAIAASGDATLAYDGGKLTVSLSEHWLAEEGRAFPVKLDPSVTLGATRDTFVDEITPSTSYASGGDLYAGREGSGHDHNALTYFDLSAHVPAGTFVQEAKLNLWPKYETASTGTKNLQAQKVTQAWDANATWLGRDATNNWSAAGGALDGTVLDTQAAGTGAWKRFNITETVTDWVNNPSTNHGVAITDGASTVDRAIVFASSEWVDSGARPYLEVTSFQRAGSMPNYTLLSESITDRSSLGVNVAGGNMLLSATDLQVAGTGLPLSVERFYNSTDPWNGSFGNGGGRISLGNDIVLYECDGVGSRCLIGPSGFRARFKRQAGNPEYKTPAGVGNLTLRRATATSGEFTLTDNSSGTKWNFFDNSWSFNNRITDRHGNQISFDAAGPYGSLSKITDTQGREFPVTANSAGYITKIEIPTSVLPGGASWQYGYNAYNFLTSVTDPEGKVTEYRYGSNDKIDRVKDPRGNFIYILYDTHGRVTSVRREVDGTTTNDVTTTYAYHAANSGDCTAAKAPGNVGRTVVTDARSKATQYCWNKDGAVIKAFDADGDETSTTFDPTSGNVTEFGAYAGTSSPLSTNTTVFDGGGATTGRPTTAKGAAKEKSVIGYAPTGSVQDGSAYGRNQPSSVTSPHGNLTRFKYDDATASSSFNVTEINDAQTPTGTPGLKTQFTYKSTNKALLETVTQDGKTTTYEYDVKGNLTKVKHQKTAGGATLIGDTEYTYDGLSRVTKMKDGRTGQWVDLTYDKLGRQLTAPDSDGQNTTLTYDNNGNVLTRTAPGQSSSYTYDKLNRKTSENLHGASTTYGYDKTGNLTSLTDASGLVSYGYDNVGRVASVTSFPASGSTADTTSYNYQDPHPTLAPTSSWVTQTLPGSGTIKTTRDLSGKITEILVKDNAGNQELKRTYEYGAVAWDGDATETEKSDLIGTLTEQNGGTGVTPTVKQFVYTLSGQIKEIASATGASSSLEEFTYDGSGNRTRKVATPSGGSPSTTSYAYNEVNQLCWKLGAASSAACSAPPSGSTTYSYDAAGNQVTGGFTGSYDAKGRISGFNGIYSKILSPTNNEIVGLGAGNTFTNTSLGVQRIEMAYNLSKLIRTPEDASVVAQVRDSVKSWFVQDHLGSTIALTDAAGNVARSYGYDVDGNGSTSGSGPESWIKYAGGHDIGGGLYHFGARFYQPSSGRWTQMDPLQMPGDLRQHNRYGYAAGNPINYNDPMGMDIFDSPFTRDLKRWGGKAVRAARVVGSKTPWGAVISCGIGAASTAGGNYSTGARGWGLAGSALAGCAGGVGGFKVGTKFDR